MPMARISLLKGKPPAYLKALSDGVHRALVEAYQSRGLVVQRRPALAAPASGGHAMIAMQYSLVLPADYDMAIVERRIAERGHLTDGLPGLAFKAYLQARKGDGRAIPDNLYAPFYLWRTIGGMNDFLCGPGFVALTQSFGWPAVSTWSVWHADSKDGMGGARHALRETVAIAPHTDLAALRRAEVERSRAMLGHPDLLATVAGFDPGAWKLVRFQLWRTPPARGVESEEGQVRIYGVGHVSAARAPD